MNAIIEAIFSLHLIFTFLKQFVAENSQTFALTLEFVAPAQLIYFQNLIRASTEINSYLCDRGGRTRTAITRMLIHHEKQQNKTK